MSAATSKRLFVSWVRKSYEWAGWVIIAISAIIGVPPFYVIISRLLNWMFGLFNLPSNLAWFLSQLAWGGAIVACVFGIVKVLKSRMDWLTKFALIATLAFAGSAIFRFGSDSALGLVSALIVAVFAALAWWTVQAKQLAPFIIFRNKQSVERMAVAIEREEQAKPFDVVSRASQIRAAATVNSSTTVQLARACAIAVGAYIVEAGVNLAVAFPDPIATLFRLGQGLFIGTFFTVLSPILYQLIWIGITCSLTEIAALQLVGTDRIAAFLDGQGGADRPMAPAPQPAQPQVVPVQQPRQNGRASKARGRVRRILDELRRRAA